MKRLLLPLLAFSLVTLLVAGCDALNESEPGDGGDVKKSGGTVMLQGQVLDAETGNPIEEALITVRPSSNIYLTDAEGRYEAEIEIDSTMNVTVSVEKNGYSQSSFAVKAGVELSPVAVPILKIARVIEEEPQSGQAASILLMEQPNGNIGVVGSGSTEVAQIVFQVTDSLGRPVVLDHAIDVNFTLGEQPNGGEYIFPETAATDNAGRVTVNVASGTKAGVVQVIAEATNASGVEMRSQPVALSIHGGLPNQRHFTLSANRRNFAGRRLYNLENPVSVIVGDEYSNPVKPGTVVYFDTDSGVIEGSVKTDSKGRGTVDLLSANPLPPTGIGVVTATTADKNGNTVQLETPVIFSGWSDMRISPMAIPEDWQGSTYTITLNDDRGLPLVAGTTISVAAKGENVVTSWSSLTLDDSNINAFVETDGSIRYEAQTGPGHTEFTFSVGRGDGIDTPILTSIAVSVTSPNGDIAPITLGFGGVTATSRDFEVIQVDDTTVRIVRKDSAVR